MWPPPPAREGGLRISERGFIPGRENRWEFLYTLLVPLREGYLRQKICVNPRLSAAKILLGLFLTFLCVETAAQETTRPRVLLVLCDAITLDDLRNNAFPHLAHFAETGAIGLMNGAVAGPKTPTSAILTLATGQRIPSESTDEQAANAVEFVPEPSEDETA